MLSLLQLAAASAVALIVACTWQTYSLRAKRQRFIREKGCKEPIWYPHTDRVNGSDITDLRTEAIRDGRLKLLHLEHHRQLGHTWQEKVDGHINIYTIHSENLKCIFTQRIREFSWIHSKRNLHTLQLVGKGGFFGPYETSRWVRKLINPTFNKYETGTMPMLKSHVDLFMEQVPQDGKAFDLQPALKRLVS